MTEIESQREHTEESGEQQTQAEAEQQTVPAIEQEAQQQADTDVETDAAYSEPEQAEGSGLDSDPDSEQADEGGEEDQPDRVSPLAPEKIQKIIEAAIFAADSPLDRDAMLKLFDEGERPGKAQLSQCLEALADSYQERGVELKEVASGFRFQVRKDLGPWVSRMWQEKPPRYSRAIMETLALIAYRQPITRGEIEEIRGVSVSTHIVKTLQERGWVRIVGHRDVPGRPAMFATTRLFLDYFDLKSLEELPPLSEIKDLDKLNEELQLEDTQPQVASADQAESDSGETVQADGNAQEGAARESDSSAQSGPQSESVASEGSADGNTESPTYGKPEEPDIDESELMKMDEVDKVLESVEASFRRPREDELQLETSAVEQGETPAQTPGHEAEEQQVSHQDEQAEPAGSASEAQDDAGGEAGEDAGGASEERNLHD